MLGPEKPKIAFNFRTWIKYLVGLVLGLILGSQVEVTGARTLTENGLGLIGGVWNDRLLARAW